MEFFKNIQTLEELKKEYKRLAFLHHPDRGGNVEIMKLVNAQYDKYFNLLKAKEANSSSNSNQNTYEETSSDFKDIIDKLIHLKDINIEICGHWLWLTGNTYPVKEYLKEIGFQWSKSKKMWFNPMEENFTKGRKRTLSMDKIREKYGSTIINSNSVYAIA